MVPTKYETKIEYLSNAGNHFLINLCSALKEQVDVKVLSYLGVPVPDEIKPQLERDNSMQMDIDYFYSSKMKLGGVTRYRNAIKSALQNSDYLMTYNTVYAWLFAPNLANKYGKKSVLLLADYSPKESYTSVFRKLYARIQLKSIRRYDYVIGLSDNSRKYLKNNQKFLCVEGGISKEFYHYFDTEYEKVDSTIHFHYAGILEPVTGIEMLVNAFMEINDPSIELRISGRGSLSSWVEEQAKRDSRICYLGCLSYEDYIRKLKTADVLVNPRDMSLPENANNFPSKIMDYLATGKNIISTKFPGWEKYQDHIDFVDSNEEALKEKMIALSMQMNINEESNFKERRLFTEQFIWQKQVGCILKFVSEK